MVQMVTHFKIDSAFTKSLPMQHPYLQNMFNHIADLPTGLSFQIVLEENDPDKNIFNKEYLKVVEEIHDKVFYIKLNQ